MWYDTFWLYDHMVNTAYDMYDCEMCNQYEQKQSFLTFYPDDSSGLTTFEWEKCHTIASLADLL